MVGLSSLTCPLKFFTFQLLPRKHHARDSGRFCHHSQNNDIFKEGLYRVWCGAYRLGDSGVHTLGDNSGFVNPAGQLLLAGGVKSEWIPST